ncbi:MAG: Transcriptional regulatory protein TyrR [Candidatus Erwinia impunctatus]|nr:Transcriptional regulatory protein TyrR [Culicoides impunctatus]
MRLEVFCHDRLGLTRELLDLLVTRHIDLRGIEIAEAGRIYLNFPPVEFEVFSQLMTDIRRIAGVTDVITVNAFPSEREHHALAALLEALPEPVFSLDLKGRVDLMNQPARLLFTQSRQSASALNFNLWHTEFSYSEWLSQGAISCHHQAEINGLPRLLEVAPIFTNADSGTQGELSGAVLMFRSAVLPAQATQPHGSKDEGDFRDIVAVSDALRHVVTQAKKMAMLDAPLLIEGETGTGKELLARACHQYSKRRNKPFLALNCAALPDDVAESELFGHAPGAYPNALEGKKGFFEQAHGGSVLLDEIGEMTPRMQSKLLRFINDGTFRRVGDEHEVHVDVRVICATQKHLTNLVTDGVFREDLLYRLNVLTLRLPPLREHPEDILPLTRYFVERFADEQGIERPGLSSELLTILQHYRWPGNVRQLKNTLYRALTELQDNQLRPEDIHLPETGLHALPGDAIMTGSLDEIMRRFECSVLTHLYLSYPSTRKLAQRLEVSHTAIANKLREYGVGKQKRNLQGTETDH